MDAQLLDDRAVATVLIQRGCLKPGMHLVCGRTQAKVRVMKDSTGKIVKAAYPGDAITVSGWKEVPSAGDEAISGSDGDIKRALANRLRKAEQDAAFLDLEVINASRRAERGKREAEEVAAVAAAEAGQHGLRPQREHSVEADGPKELRIVIKGDVSGSVEAVAGALQGIGNNLAVVKIVSTGVGDVTESDVQMAQSTEGTQPGIMFSAIDVTVSYCWRLQESSSPSASTFRARSRSTRLRRACQSARRPSSINSWTRSSSKSSPYCPSSLRSASRARRQSCSCLTFISRPNKS